MIEERIRNTYTSLRSNRPPNRRVQPPILSKYTVLCLFGEERKEIIFAKTNLFNYTVSYGIIPNCQ